MATTEQIGNSHDSEGDNMTETGSSQEALDAEIKRERMARLQKAMNESGILDCGMVQVIDKLRQTDSRIKHICEHCAKTFKQKRDYETHLRVHTGERPFKCEDCGMAFKVKSGLKEHMLIHKGIKPHGCPHCDQFFRSQRTLQNHIRTHTGEKPFECEVCSKRFTQSGGLKTHMKTHTGEKPFVCQYEGCGLRFALKKTLKYHENTHTGVKRYQCHYCSKIFSRKDQCVSHIRRIHLEDKEKFECAVCSKTFTEKSSLLRHAEKQNCKLKLYRGNSGDHEEGATAAASGSDDNDDGDDDTEEEVEGEREMEAAGGSEIVVAKKRKVEYIVEKLGQTVERFRDPNSEGIVNESEDASEFGENEDFPEVLILKNPDAAGPRVIYCGKTYNAEETARKLSAIIGKDAVILNMNRPARNFEVVYHTDEMHPIGNKGNGLEYGEHLKEHESGIKKQIVFAREYSKRRNMCEDEVCKSFSKEVNGDNELHVDEKSEKVVILGENDGREFVKKVVENNE
ncbi:zinc finger protein 732-like [Dreissena polymorpha]|uniref:C2H2-type domain-containing protein n=1 Tax=Dreissena polymorpha TaxID=45954 RepID=A0A9D4M848_DREPO|nr:zinc finger protein 732-like [Dreissena polymorpha]KAH3870086.1 hypothetical protein DPMN_033266 [Dreissena polymorpha]